MVDHPQRDPPPTARLWGLAPVTTGRPATRLVSGSIRVTLSPPPELVTQTAPGVAAMSRGAQRTVMAATLRPVAGSMRITRSSPHGPARSPGATLATYSGPSPTAMVASANPETRSGSPTTALVAGSIRTTLPAACTHRTLSAVAMLLARNGDDRGEPAAVEDGRGAGAGGRGRLPGRPRGVPGAGAGGRGNQHRHHQRLVQAWSAEQRPPELVGGLAWRISPPRTPRVSTLPSPTPHALGQFLERAVAVGAGSDGTRTAEGRKHALSRGGRRGWPGRPG
jgi:hypothetical protein